MRRALLLVPVVALLAVGGVALFRVRPTAELGRPAPGFELPRLDGDGTIALAGLRGTPVVINFWASWCEPCKDEAPELARAWEELGDAVRFLGVNILDGRDDALAFARRYGLGYPSLRDTRGVVAKRYGVTGVPETVFIDASGRVAGAYIGAFTSGRLLELTRELADLEPGQTLRITGRGEAEAVPG